MAEFFDGEVLLFANYLFFVTVPKENTLRGTG